MTNPVKERITQDLQQAKEVGKQRGDRIREIIRSAMFQVQSEVKSGTGDLRSLVKEAFSAAVSNLQESGNEVKEDVVASVEGVLEGISSARRKTIAETEAKVKQLQAQLNAQEEELEQEIESSLAGIEDASKEAPSQMKQQIEEAVASLQNTEEAALLRKRYAQLQAQLAILRANLAARTGSHYDVAQGHLDDAKSWYDKARPQAEELKGQADQRYAKLEEKMGEAGTALAKREHRVRQLLSDLLHQAAEAIRDDNKTDKAVDVLPPTKEITIEERRLPND